MSIVRRLADEDFDEYARITLEAYPAMFTNVTEERQKGWKERMRNTQNEDGPISYHGCFRDDKLVGAMRHHDFKMTLYETQTFVGGVGNIGVDLLHKKEHVSKEIMEYFHSHYRDRGATMTTLYPFRPDFYVKMGYGYGQKMNKYRFRPVDLPRGSRENVSWMREDDLPEMLEFYNRLAHVTHGMIEKEKTHFERVMKRNKVILHREDGRITGFMAFGFKKLREDHFLLQDIEVNRLIYETGEALRGLFSFLQTQLDQVERIVLYSNDHDIQFMLLDPRNGEPHIFYTSQETNQQGVGIMYRVINKERLFKELHNHSFNGETLRVKLNIKDTFLPENHGSIIIHFVEGKPRIREEGYDVEASMDVAWFSSLIMGVVDFRKLHTYGLVEVSDAEYIDPLDRLFRVHTKPVTIEEF
ncbi:MAG: GNAT family N-acetyltransferase [Candidatus Bathyarchaeota archaeon]|nr:GNAT family N-acetyltransferase [Candidatus Bathyarchaeota archaeon]